MNYFDYTSDAASEESGKHNDFIPIEKRVQLSFLSCGSVKTKDGLIRVAPGPQPWEFESFSESTPKVIEEPAPREYDIESVERLILTLLSLFEDLVVAGLFSTRRNRSNANRSTYFRCYHEYCPEKKNGPALAVKIGKSRTAPQRYSNKFSHKKHAFCHPSRRSLIASVLGETITQYSEKAPLEKVVIQLHRDLCAFKSALIASSTWDAEDPFDICAEIYKNNPSRRARQKLKKNGCSTPSAHAVFSLIRTFKEKEKCHGNH